MLPDSLPANLALFVGAAAVIFFVGTRLTRSCDELADRTGLGEAFMGAIFLGAVTSLPGITASVTAATTGAASLALSNAYGGIAAQTLFVAIADLFYRGANLEHAAASVENMLSGVGLVVLLGMLVYAHATPDLAIFAIHPVSLLLPVAYFFSMVLVRKTRKFPMWQATQTRETAEDEPEEKNEKMTHKESVHRWVVLALSAAAIIAAGWLLTRSGQIIAGKTGLNESILGALLVAVITSLPELVTAVAAVRQGALTLAVGGVLGGNVFDTLFAAVADYAYRDGSIYAAASPRETGMVGLAIVMASLILLGLLHRERRGPAGIGFESLSVMIVYVLGIVFLFIGG
ncbi:MAG: sodium:calcium antiporter [Opitutales bacterium]